MRQDEKTALREVVNRLQTLVDEAPKRAVYVKGVAQQNVVQDLMVAIAELNDLIGPEEAETETASETEVVGE